MLPVGYTVNYKLWATIMLEINSTNLWAKKIQWCYGGQETMASKESFIFNTTCIVLNTEHNNE